GLDSSLFGRRDAANTWTGGNQFNAGINVLSGLKAGGTLVADGSQLYEGGIGLASKYLGKTATAANTQLLDGIDSSALAKVGSNNVFTGANTFSQNIAVKGTGLMTAVNNSTSAVTNLEANTSAAESRVNNLLYFKSRCHVHNMDPGCNIYMKPPAPVSGVYVSNGQVYYKFNIDNGVGSCGIAPSKWYMVAPGAEYNPVIFSPPPSTCSPIGAVYYQHIRNCSTLGGGGNSSQQLTYSVNKYTCS
ncbi:TPA: hypothetical protein ACJ51M_005055, partial [Aeromonas hydrophila subsp. hydrophila]